MVVVDNSVLSINSFSHVFGSHEFETDDHSRNNAWVALPTFGESWQNNHHAFASSAAIGLRWWQVDLGYGLIVVLEKLGLVWGVRRPTAAMMSAKRVRSMTDGTTEPGRGAGRRDARSEASGEGEDGRRHRGVARLLPVAASSGSPPRRSRHGSPSRATGSTPRPRS